MIKNYNGWKNKYIDLKIEVRGLKNVLNIAYKENNRLRKINEKLNKKLEEKIKFKQEVKK